MIWVGTRLALDLELLESSDLTKNLKRVPICVFLIVILTNQGFFSGTFWLSLLYQLVSLPSNTPPSTGSIKPAPPAHHIEKYDNVQPPSQLVAEVTSCSESPRVGQCLSNRPHDACFHVQTLYRTLFEFKCRLLLLEPGGKILVRYLFSSKVKGLLSVSCTNIALQNAWSQTCCRRASSPMFYYSPLHCTPMRSWGI